MDVLELSARNGSLVLKKAISGSVVVTTTPSIVLDNFDPHVIAVGVANVRSALAITNVRELVRKNYVSVVL